MFDTLNTFQDDITLLNDDVETNMFTMSVTLDTFQDERSLLKDDVESNIHTML